MTSISALRGGRLNKSYPYRTHILSYAKGVPPIDSITRIVSFHIALLVIQRFFYLNPKTSKNFNIFVLY